MPELPIIIGEAPSKSGDRYHSFPLSGAVGEKLCTMAGLRPDDEGSRYGRYYWALREAFDCMNLIERYPGSQGDGAAFPMDRARARIAEPELIEELRGRVVVLLGVRLRDVFFSDTKPDFFKWRDTQVGGAPVKAVVIPHPSGLNRLYNAHEMRSRAGKTLRDAVFYAQVWSAA